MNSAENNVRFIKVYVESGFRSFKTGNKGNKKLVSSSCHSYFCTDLPTILVYGLHVFKEAISA